MGMVVLKMDTHGLVFCSSHICQHSGLPMGYELVQCCDDQSEWVVARDCRNTPDLHRCFESDLLRRTAGAHTADEV